jgi:hypothetical protein
VIELCTFRRTSTFIHLRKGLDQTVRRIEGRAADLIGVEQINIELLQIVLYKQGQRFGLHHDAGTYDENTKG